MRTPECPSDELLAAYAAGECPQAEVAKIREHIDHCKVCRQWLDDAAANEAILESLRQAGGTVTEEGYQPTVPDPPVARDAGSPATEPTSRTPLPQTIEGYELLRELSHGGQGVVYQAIQRSTKRKVAIKVLLQGPYASKAARKRFEREIELVAQLRHPNIISIFHSGVTVDGRQFYVMDYVRGQPLHRYVRQKNLSLEETLQLFAEVCEAVQYAHQRGVIHRDLKPSNIIVDAEGRPKVLDFGLAKWLAAPVDTVVSVSQQVLGTLPYMSPEQARGNPDEIDTRTDIYALGVILYELLTGHYPYPVAGQIVEVLRHIAETPPTPPSRTWSQDSGVTRRASGRPRKDDCPIDDEVQTIVLKCLSKERQRRYQSAGELARDMRHYVAGEPIEAKRESTWYVIRKSLRRYRAPVAMAVAFVVLLAALGIGMSIQADRNRRLAQSERQARLEAVAAEKQARQAKAAETTLRGRAEALADELRHGLYASRVALAQHAFEENNIRRMKALLSECPAELRKWEWHHLEWLADRSQKTLTGHTRGVETVGFSPDGTKVASGGWDRTVRVWDVRTGTAIMTLKGHSHSVNSVRFSPDGSRIASASHDGTVRVWDALTGKPLQILQGHVGMVLSAVFTPCGERIISGGIDATIRIWDTNTGQELRVLTGHESGVKSVCVMPDGEEVVTTSWDKTCRVWNLKEDQVYPLGPTKSASGMAVCPDGTCVALAHINDIEILNTETGDVARRFPNRDATVSTLTFSPDGGQIATGGADHTVRVWSRSGGLILLMRGHTEAVTEVAFSPDGIFIASACLDGSIKLWDVQGRYAVLTFPVIANRIAYTPHGSQIVSDGGGAGLQIADLESGLVKRLPTGEGDPPCFAVSPEGQTIAYSSHDTLQESWYVNLWNPKTQHLKWTARIHDQGIASIDFSPSGEQILSCSWDGEAKVWDVSDGSRPALGFGPRQGGWHAVFSPDGRLICSAGGGAHANVWDSLTGEELAHIELGAFATTVAFGPDSRLIAVGFEDGAVRIYEALTGRLTLHTQHHKYWVKSIAFMPDGDRIVSGGYDGCVLWDPVQGDQLLALRAQRTSAVAISPDGSQIAAGCEEGIKVWEVAEPDVR